LTITKKLECKDKNTPKSKENPNPRACKVILLFIRNEKDENNLKHKALKVL
jgi:hypothetical protein